MASSIATPIMAAALTTSVMDRPVAKLEMDLHMPSHKLDHKFLHEIHGGLAFFEDDVSTEAPDDTDELEFFLDDLGYESWDEAWSCPMAVQILEQLYRLSHPSKRNIDGEPLTKRAKIDEAHPMDIDSFSPGAGGDL